MTRLRGLLLGAALLMALPPAAAARTSTFAGACHFAGPIQPTPPITVVPRPGAHFSYRGNGSCAGRLDGVAVSGAPVSVTFRHVATLFDTCELGPDVNLTGVLFISAGRYRARFVVTIYLARLALAGPFALRASRGGLAVGTAMFAPGDPAAAPQQCVSGGVAAASLSASFRTVVPLVGSAVRGRRARSARH